MSKILDVLSQLMDKLPTDIIEIEKQLRDATEEKLEQQAHGDLRENQGYWSAVERMNQLTQILVNLQNKQKAWSDFKNEHANSNKQVEYVSIGSNVKLYLEGFRQTFNILVVPEMLGNAKVGAVSEGCPLGKGVMGKQVGEKFPVESEKYGILTYRIESIK